MTTPVPILGGTDRTRTGGLNVLEDHPDLGLSMLETFARQLLDAPPPAAAA